MDGVNAGVTTDLIWKLPEQKTAPASRALFFAPLIPTYSMTINLLYHEIAKVLLRHRLYLAANAVVALRVAETAGMCAWVVRCAEEIVKRARES